MDECLHHSLPLNNTPPSTTTFHAHNHSIYLYDRDDPEFSRVNLVLCNSPVIVLSTLAMVLHLATHLGGLEALAATGKVRTGVLCVYVCVCKVWGIGGEAERQSCSVLD